MSGPGRVDVLDAGAVGAVLRPRDAVRALEEALRAGLDPSVTPPRSAVSTPQGELLLMPATGADAVGVKVVSVAPGNAGRGLPRIQGVYVLFDGATLTPRAVLDGAALTTLRTPAVSVAAVRPALAREQRPLRVVVFGAGPQAAGHLRTLADTQRPTSRHGPGLDATVVVRDVPRAVLPPMDGVSTRLVGAGSTAVRAALAAADVVVCATTARRPLFPADAVSDRAVVIAVGAHELEACEVEPALAARAQVVVEDRATALREAGVVRAAVEAGQLAAQDVVAIRDVVVGTAQVPSDRPLLFVSVGMAWEDLVVARRVYEAYRAMTRGT
jgi:ornithine cyclodeaminase/alanine dehydrogenase-like protein (mu-crystallin family)